MPLTAQALVDDVGELVSLPEVVLRINEMVNDEHANAADIGRVISQDPGLATRLLKIANSPMYGSMRQIDSISRAVTILGTKQIRDIIFSTTAAKVFEGIPNDVISVADFWHHSLYCALLAGEVRPGGRISLTRASSHKPYRKTARVRFRRSRSRPGTWSWPG